MLGTTEWGSQVLYMGGEVHGYVLLYTINARWDGSAESGIAHVLGRMKGPLDLKM